MIVIGIDPGLKGGIAIIEDGRLKYTMPMPILDKKVAVQEVAMQLGLWPDPIVGIELQGIRPRQAGGGTTMTNYGRLMAVIELGGYAHREVTPAQWSRGVIQPGLAGKAKKEAAYVAAVRIFGRTVLDWLKLRPSTDGMVEATLIAHWMYERRKET